MRILAFLIIVLLFSSCGPETRPDLRDKDTTVKVPSRAPAFNADSAYGFVEKQVAFGPRVPLTIPHDKCAAWLQEQLKKYCPDVALLSGTVVGYDGKTIRLKNIIASFEPKLKKRILLCAHWDTRPIADRDTKDKEKPIDGANDGGSGVGVLLEIARLLKEKPLKNAGIDILLFDMEDYGTNYCQGSGYWAKNLHQPGYFANYGILLDMVGAKGAVFPVEGVSMEYAAATVHKVWEKANSLGYGNIFLWNEMQPITDDHVAINEIAGIPCIDIIQMDPNTGDFMPEHHRHGDNMSIIDKGTLKAVGQTVLEVIYSED